MNKINNLFTGSLFNKSIVITIKLCLAANLLSSCVPAAVVGGAATVGSVAVQDRSLGEQIDDTSVWTRVKTSLLSKQKGYSSITVTVREGRVMLTGDVENTEEKLEVIKTAWSCRGVKEVVDEISIKENNKSNIKKMALDSWITAQVKSQMVFDKMVASANYSVETVDAVVYLFGRARSNNELKRVTEIAGTVKNVKRVVSYVKIEEVK